jgi:hypothetical protein
LSRTFAVKWGEINAEQESKSNEARNPKGNTKTTSGMLKDLLNMLLSFINLPFVVFGIKESFSTTCPRL